MGKTNISWADKVWNPMTGCTKVSEGCRHCYAERMSNRFAGTYGWGTVADHFKITLHPGRLAEPLHWKKPSRIFVCSMGDLFHKDVPFAFIDKVIRNIRQSPQHTFLILTKRAHLMKKYFETTGELNNLWLGVSVEDQKTAYERIPVLLQTSAAKRFVSYEPVLEYVDFTPYLNMLDWIIMGAESGHGRRLMEYKWAVNVASQCDAAGMALFYKQGPDDDGNTFVKMPYLIGIQRWDMP